MTHTVHTRSGHPGTTRGSRVEERPLHDPGVPAPCALRRPLIVLSLVLSLSCSLCHLFHHSLVFLFLSLSSLSLITSHATEQPLRETAYLAPDLPYNRWQCL